MKKITAQEVLDKMTQACNLHDDFIGEVNKKYDLPEDGTAKEAKYDAPMINLLSELSDDLTKCLTLFSNGLILMRITLKKTLIFGLIQHLKYYLK